MIPLKDENPIKTVPVVTFGLIAVNILVFLHQAFLSSTGAESFIQQYGAVPRLIVRGDNLKSIITSMFLHGSIMHIAGNMLYLYIFGDNVEAICGHFRFLIFYILCGVMAFLSHFALAPFSSLPMIGASGAISGVMGAYILKFPRNRVYVLIPFFIFIWRVFAIPAVVVLGLWFLLQIFSGVASNSSQGGVAFFAHIGGFIAGLLLIRPFQKGNYTVRY